MKKKYFKRIICILLLHMLLIQLAPPNVYSEGSDESDLYLMAYADYDRAYEVLSGINSARKKAGVHTLSMDQTLMDAAYVRAAETVVYFEHARPNGMKWSSVSPKVKGENLGRGTGSTSKIMKLWLKSSGHKANIVRPNFNSVGVACIEYGGTYYWVQLFGTSGSDGAERPSNGIRSIPLDLPSIGIFAQEYEITSEDAKIKERKNSEIPIMDIKPGKSASLGLVGGRYVFDPAHIEWSSSDPDVASINENGILTVTGRGESTITAATAEEKRASIYIDTREDISKAYIMEVFGRRTIISDREIIDEISPRPSLMILTDEGPLREGIDFETFYFENDKPGRAYVVATGLGEYKGKYSLKYNVNL